MEVIKPYSTYKDSGIPWLGEVPKHWIEFKPKTIGYLFGGLTGKKGDDFKIEKEINISPFIPFTNIANNFIIDKNKLAFVKTLENEKQNLVQKNDLLFLMSSENFEDIGKTSLLNDEIDGLYLNSFCKGFRIEDSNFYPKFLNYIFSADVNRKRLSVEARGFTRINLKIGKVNDLAMFAPANIIEQTAIANFLDYKTAKIDRFIFKKKQLIKLLNEQKAAIINDAVTKGLNPNAKMKPSGIEWLGDIPEHWEVRKLKGICKAYGRIGFRGYKTTDLVNQGEGAITISPSNMKYDFMTFEKCTFLSWEKYEESPEIKIFNNDILMVKTGSTYGKVGIVRNLAQEATINPQLLVLKNIKINPDYLYLLLKSNLIQSQVKTEVIGSTIPTISQTKILNFNLVTPPDKEIESLLAYIEKETSIITKTIATIEKEIALVQEYRTALISEAVTGKIDVRDYKVPSFEVNKEYAEIEEEMSLVAEEEINLE